MHDWRDQVKLVFDRLSTFVCVRDLKLVNLSHLEHFDELEELVKFEIRLELDDMNEWA